MTSPHAARALLLLQHLKRAYDAQQSLSSLETSSSSELPLRALFNYGRLRGDRINKVWHVLFIIYSPLGVLLVVVRMVLFAASFMVFPFLPERWTRLLTPQALRIILGIVLRTKNFDELRRKPSPVLVSNHIHDYDTYLIPMVHPDCRPVISDHTTKIAFLGPILRRGYSAWHPLWVAPRQEKVDARENLKQDIMKHFSKFQFPIAILPEGGLTNGENGLMLYKRFIFTLGLPVRPIAERYVNVWPVNHDYLGSTWLRNMLWAMFLPFHIFELTALPEMAPKPGESADAFAKRVQCAMAEVLQLQPTNYPYEAKIKLRKEVFGY